MNKPFISFLVVFLFPLLSSCGARHWFVRHQDPLTAAERAQLGQAYLQEGKLELALDQYEMASKRAPDEPDYLYAQGVILFELNEIDQSEKIFKTLIKKERHPGALNNLAHIALEKGKDLEAAEALAQESSAIPSPFQAYAFDTLAEIQLELGKDAEALVSIEKGLALLEPSQNDVKESLEKKKDHIQKGLSLPTPKN